MSNNNHPQHLDYFTHNNLHYDLNKVRLLTRPEKAFLLPIQSLLWIQRFDKFDEDRVVHAKLRYPLLVTRWRDRWTVVDGLHRLECYRRRGITVIPVKEVTQDMLKQSRIYVS